MPSLNALRAFDAVARLGSYQKAADELAVSSPAVQQLVRSLEEALDRQLIVSTKRKLSISEAGMKAVPYIQRGFEQLSAGVEAIRTHGIPSEIRLSVEPSFAAMWLLPRIGTFQRLSPGIEVFIDASEKLVDLARRETDIAIRYRAPNRDEFVSTRLLDDETIAVCSPRLLAGQDVIEDRLASIPLIHFDRNGGITLQLAWTEWLKAVGIDRAPSAPGLRFSSYNMVIQSAIAGHGIALASRPLVQDSIDVGLLADATSRSVGTDRGYDVMTTAYDSTRPEVRVFIEWLLGQVRPEARHAVGILQIE